MIPSFVSYSEHWMTGALENIGVDTLRKSCIEDSFAAAVLTLEKPSFSAAPFLHSSSTPPLHVPFIERQTKLRPLIRPVLFYRVLKKL
jgi:hypothetical protein